MKSGTPTWLRPADVQTNVQQDIHQSKLATHEDRHPWNPEPAGHCHTATARRSCPRSPAPLASTHQTCKLSRTSGCISPDACPPPPSCSPILIGLYPTKRQLTWASSFRRTSEALHTPTSPWHPQELPSTWRASSPSPRLAGHSDPWPPMAYVPSTVRQ